MFGYSAGGHLSALIASLADETIQTRLSASQWPESDARWRAMPTIRAICIGSPPCDFRSLPIDNTSLAYFLGGSRREKQDLYVAASPAAHVSPSDPATQIIHGDGDLIVPIAGSRDFHQAQLDHGVDSRLHIIANQGHMIAFLNPETSGKAIEFFHEVLDCNQAAE
jgi:triacylglycerol lipase